MSTTENPIIIGTVNGLPVTLEEGKGNNVSVVTHAGKTCGQGFAGVILGKEVAELYAAWYAANRK